MSGRSKSESHDDARARLDGAGREDRTEGRGLYSAEGLANKGNLGIAALGIEINRLSFDRLLFL